MVFISGAFALQSLVRIRFVFFIISIFSNRTLSTLKKCIWFTLSCEVVGGGTFIKVDGITFVFGDG